MKNSHLALGKIIVLVNFIIQDFLQIAELLTSFSHERKYERIEKKFKTQNPILSTQKWRKKTSQPLLRHQQMESHNKFNQKKSEKIGKERKKFRKPKSLRM